MRIAVVTPYHREADDILRRCLESVRSQTHPECRHFVVADGFPNDLVDTFDVRHIRLSNAHADNGNLARCVGAFAAMSEGYDAVAFLDADNWYRSDHIARMVALQAASGAVVCTSGRSIHRSDGSVLWQRDDAESDGDRFADTSCLCIFRPGFDLLSVWGAQPPIMGPICDQVMWMAIVARGVSRAHDPEPSVAFHTRYASHYLAVGEQPPPDAKPGNVILPAAAALDALSPTQHFGLLLGLGGADDVVSLSASIKSRPPSHAIELVHGERRSRLIVPDDGGVAEAVDEIFRHGIYRPVAGLPPPRTILDIGAGVGAAAAYFRLTYPEAALFCVEPEPSASAFLEANARTIGDCETIRAGVYCGTLPRPFYLAPGGIGGSLTVVSDRMARLLLIDAGFLVDNLPCTTIDLIKIAAAGVEVPVLVSLRSRLHATAQVLLRYQTEADRDLIDAMLRPTHFPWRSQSTAPGCGVVCYVSRAFADLVPSDGRAT